MTQLPFVAMFLRFANRLRFRQLFFLTAGLFMLDVLIPDFIPFVDELLLGLLVLLFGNWRKPQGNKHNHISDAVKSGRES